MHRSQRKVCQTIKQTRYDQQKEQTVTVCPVSLSLWIDIHHMVSKHINRGAVAEDLGARELPRRKRTNSAWPRKFWSITSKCDSNSPFLGRHMHLRLSSSYAIILIIAYYLFGQSIFMKP